MMISSPTFFDIISLGRPRVGVGFGFSRFVSSFQNEVENVEEGEEEDHLLTPTRVVNFDA